MLKVPKRLLFLGFMLGTAYSAVMAPAPLEARTECEDQKCTEVCYGQPLEWGKCAGECTEGQQFACSDGSDGWCVDVWCPK